MNDEVNGFGDISPEWLANELDDHGVVRLQGVISDEWLDAMRGSVTGYIAANADRDFFIDQADSEVGSPPHRLVSAVRQLFSETTSLRRPNAGSTDDALHCSMLVRTGTARTLRSHLFHYDACVLTMVVPVYIPQGPIGTCGELAAFGNKRPYRRFLTSHLVETMLTHNTLFRRFVTKKVHDAPDKYVVDFQPGDAYLFWGYRTYHGNLGCAPGLLRTTLVLHYGQVHPVGRALKVAWRFSRSRRDLRRLQTLPAVPASSEVAA